MKAMPWFRLYHRIIDDEKIRLLAFEDRWHFVALCCLKADGLLDQERGSLWERKVAVKMGLATRELDEVFRRLREVELIDDDANPVAWGELQFRSDRDETATERQRRKRMKDKGLPDVTEASRVTVTNVTATDTDTDTDTDRDTEEEEEKDIPLKPEKRAVKLPQEWEPKLTPRSQGIVDKWPAGKFEREVEKFIDHAASNGRTALDWQAAFRTWINNADEWMQGNGKQQSPRDNRDGLTRYLDEELGIG